MPSAADADLARRDPALPGLAMLLDPDAFAEALSPAVPGLASARVTYVRYKPATSCLAGYRLEAAGGPVDVYATAYRPETRDKLADDRGRLVLRDRAVVVAFFPDDDELPALARLAEPDGRVRLLQKLLPDRPDLWGGEVVPLRYKPGRRYVGRLAVDGVPRAALKAYSKPGFAAAQANAKVFVSCEEFRSARRMGRSNRYRLLALEWLPGRLLSTALAHPDFTAGSVEAVGAALAGLHARKPSRLTGRTPAEEAALLPPVAAWLGHVCPSLADRARRLADRVGTALQRLPDRGRPLHGDFYAKQVLLDGTAVGLIDFDEAVRGDPAHDLGLFLAHLEGDALRGRIPAERVGPVRAALLRGYQSAARHPVSSVALYTAAGLLRLAPHPFRNREPDWPGRTAALLNRAEELLGRTAPVAAVGGSRS